MKFLAFLVGTAACGAEPAAQIDKAAAKIESHAPPIAAKMAPLRLRCEGDIDGAPIRYEVRKLPHGSLVYAVVGDVEASSVSAESSLGLQVQRIGLLVESEPPTFLRLEVAANGMRLRAARLASVQYVPCWQP